MTNTELIVEVFAVAGKPLTLDEVLNATGLEDPKKVSGLIYYLVSKERLIKCAPTADGASLWRHPSAAETDASIETAQPAGSQRPIEVPDAGSFKRQQERVFRKLPAPTVASMMATSLGGEALPEVCVNFGTATVVISCGDDVVKIETLAAAQHLHAQMEQAIAALGALDGR